MFGDRLLAEHVKRRSRDLAGVERLAQRCLVHQSPARHVDHAHAVPHRGESLGIEPVLRLGGNREVDGDEVGPGVHVLGRLGTLHSELAEALLGDVGVEGDDAHSEAERPLRHQLTDAPEADHAKRLVVQLDAAELRALPGAMDERLVRLRHLASECQQQRERVLGRRDHVRLRRVRDDHAALGGGVHVHVVHPDPRAAHGLQALGAPEQLRVELRRGADQDAVELADPALELLVVPVDPELHLEAGVAQQLNPRVADLLLDEDPHA